MTTVSEVQRAMAAAIRDLPTDLAKRYQAKLEGYRADFEPRGSLENDLVAEMAHLVLQLEQTRAVAAAVVAIRVETAGAEARAGALPRRSRRAAGRAPLADARLRRHARRRPAAQALRHVRASPAPYDRHIPQAPQGRRHRRIQYHRTRARVRRHRTGRPSSEPPCSPSQEQWQPYAPVHEPSNGLPAAPANQEFNTTSGDVGPDGVVTPSAVIADGPAGYHDGTTAGRAGEFASAPTTPPARTKRTTSAIRARTPTPRLNSSSRPPWPTSASRRPRQSASNWGCSSERSWPRPRRFTAWNFSSKPATTSTTGEAPSPFPENPGTPIRD